MKVAIAKSRLYRGGVFQVLESIIRILNKHDIIPDIVTLKSDILPQDSDTIYSGQAKFKIKTILYNLKMPYEWHFVFYNFFSRNILSKYDLIIDSNNTAFMQLNNGKIIHYIHYPRKHRIQIKQQSTHFPEGKNKPWLNLANDAFNLFRKIYHFDKSLDNNNTIIANSQFTKRAILDSYPYLVSSDIQVIYPPVDIDRPYKSQKRKENLIISLGRISPEKRQLEQIKIADKLPHFEFHIVGFAKDIDYLKKCKTLINKLRLDNVKISTNATKPELDSYLSEATYFLHNVRNEPFGITTVQGIAHGLTPIVHNSGGQIEIVKYSKLRFDTPSQAIEIIKTISKSKEAREEVIVALQSHIRQYGRNNFELQMGSIIDKSLNSRKNDAQGIH